MIFNINNNKKLPLVILAGGLGSRLTEETILKPKPLVEIGGVPIILHLMKYYSYYGVKKFIICLGYKGEMIRDFFINRYLKKKILTIESRFKSKINLKFKKDEEWEIKFVETGKKSLTGKRLKLIEPFIDKDFLFTYGDGLSDIPINKVISKFYQLKCIGLLSAVKIDPKFGVIKFTGKSNLVTSFKEKKDTQATWINAGFGIFSKKIFKYLKKNENIAFENEPLARLAKDKQLYTYKHFGNWKCMDTLRDKHEFEEILKKNPFWIKKRKGQSKT